ncbi:hypothetical protein SDJN02_01667, partial [Cucurbita argyrosperma subsp. argyrosperma]
MFMLCEYHVYTRIYLSALSRWCRWTCRTMTSRKYCIGRQRKSSSQKTAHRREDEAGVSCLRFVPFEDTSIFFSFLKHLTSFFILTEL